MSDMLEADWRNTVIELAGAYGWRVYSPENTTRVIRRKSGQEVRVRNVNPAGVGFPDMVLVRRGVLIFAELKRDQTARRSKGGSWLVTPEQEEWLAELGKVADDAVSRTSPPGVDPVLVQVWRPADYDAIERLLR